MLMKFMNIVFFIWLGVLIFGAILKVTFKEHKNIKIINSITWGILATLTIVIAIAVFIILKSVQAH